MERKAALSVALSLNPLFFFGVFVVSANSFSYLAVVGNSGTGKTTYVKTMLNAIKWDQLYVVDPNRQYGDFMREDNAAYITPNELKAALNVIGKKLLLTQKKGILVIEDLNFTLSRLSETLQISTNKAKNILYLLLENLRKYDVKVILVMHDIDRDLVGKCDTKVFFQVPLSNYKVREYSAVFGMDMNEVVRLPHYSYVSKNGSEMERGHIEALESHEQIEKDKSFMIRDILSKCRSLSEKVLVLRYHLEMKNTEIASRLNINTNTVEVIVSRMRKRGIPIPDARKSFRLESIAF